jgi:glutathione peroxidase
MDYAVTPRFLLAGILFMLNVLFSALPISVHAAGPSGGACPALLDRTMTGIDGKPRALCQHAGQVVLVVNTASECGYTPQYEGLEALHRKYRSQGFVVLGFPSNDFGAQEPGSNKQIAEFCVNQFAIEFPMFEKTAVRGTAANPFYADLARASGKSPQWNFHKYLIGRDGKTVQSFDSAIAPTDKRLVGAIEKNLPTNK